MAEKLKIIKLKKENDRISFLPEQVMNTILGSLPIRDAIHTSFLSRRWRYKWRSMSDLTFDSNSFPSSKKREPSSFTRIYLSKVLRFLFLHKGDIRRFEFSSISKVISSKVDMWLDYLVAASVQQLVLTFTKKYRIPSSVFRFDKLTVLDLKSCKLSLPASFDGFKNLTTLRLHCITFKNDNTLEILINQCQLLRVLDIGFLLGSQQRLILHAPNLRSLTIIGSLSYLEFKETRMMTYVRLALNPSESLYDLTVILSNLSNVEHLEFWGSNGDDSLFKKINITPSIIKDIKFNQLKKLHLGVNLNCSKETSIVCCILENCPLLTYLLIHFEHSEVEDGSSAPSDLFWKNQESRLSSFDNLKFFDITNLHGSKSELMFIEYIYGITPMLDVSNIKINWKDISFGEGKICDILIELLSFKKAYAAKVIIEKP